MTSYQNKKKDRFLSEIITASLESATDNLTIRCKFNFSYFDPSQTAGQGSRDWGVDGLSELLEKLTEFSKESLEYWKQQGRLVVYCGFPKKTDFLHPKHVPHDVHWGRFRIEQAVRLAGFVLPGQFRDKVHQKTGVRFDCNTFYVVFLDQEHKFYKTEKR
jgi:hypothetical protein